jgi:hypothetical protein
MHGEFLGEGKDGFSTYSQKSYTLSITKKKLLNAVVTVQFWLYNLALSSRFRGVTIDGVNGFTDHLYIPPGATSNYSASPGLVMWDLWWTKWRWGRFSPSTSVSPANVYSTNCSTITLIYHLGLVQ